MATTKHFLATPVLHNATLHF